MSEGNNNSFAWLIEAPGQQYLSARQMSNHYDFVWTADHNKALRFFSEEQADSARGAIRVIKPDLFMFEINLGNARAVEHGWI